MSTTLRPPLDRDVASLIDAAAPRLTVTADTPPDIAREREQAFCAWMRGDAHPSLDSVPTRDETIHSPDGAAVPIRWYGPHSDSSGDTVVYIHGGGWTAGSVDAYDLDLRLMQQVTGLTIASVEYRRTPEHPFPAPLDDCVTVVRALASRSPRTLSIAGDSAGGNLALGAALATREEQLLHAMLLIYPVVDPEAFENASYRENGAGYLLERDGMVRFWRMYTPDVRERLHPFAAPSRAELHKLPPTVVVSAGYDPLRDEDRELAARLIAADVEVTHLPNPTLTHGFQQMTPRIPAETAAVETMYRTFVAAIKRSRDAHR